MVTLTLITVRMASGMTAILMRTAMMRRWQLLIPVRVLRATAPTVFSTLTILFLTQIRIQVPPLPLLTAVTAMMPMTVTALPALQDILIMLRTPARQTTAAVLLLTAMRSLRIAVTTLRETGFPVTALPPALSRLWKKVSRPAAALKVRVQEMLPFGTAPTRDAAITLTTGFSVMTLQRHATTAVLSHALLRMCALRLP
ncbi:MAG: hypothetical protein D6698_15945 [Gammaproteobacteria bacterium]|nr:MAG: hypothetical protein D6698_15945 [Gammaproteobacteria bacterium]